MRKGMPDVNDVIETPKGMAKVVETDILKELVKARLFTGEKDDDGQEKLGSDIYEFTKDDIKKCPRKGK